MRKVGDAFRVHITNCRQKILDPLINEEYPWLMLRQRESFSRYRTQVRTSSLSQNEALTRHVVKAQLTRHTHTHSHMHTGKRQQTRHTRTQLPAGAIVANLAPSAHALYALFILCLHANRRLPFQAFTFGWNYHQVLRNRDEASYCLAKGSSSENVTGTPLVALAARRSRRVRTAGHHLQVDRSRSLPRRNLGTTGVSKDRDHVKARKERTPG